MCASARFDWFKATLPVWDFETNSCVLGENIISKCGWKNRISCSNRALHHSFAQRSFLTNRTFISIVHRVQRAHLVFLFEQKINSRTTWRHVGRLLKRILNRESDEGLQSAWQIRANPTVHKHVLLLWQALLHEKSLSSPTNTWWSWAILHRRLILFLFPNRIKNIYGALKHSKIHYFPSKKPVFLSLVLKQTKTCVNDSTSSVIFDVQLNVAPL